MKSRKVVFRKKVRNWHFEIPSDPQDMTVCIIVLMMALYYVWRMFYLTPSYEELHDYYYFISRGPWHSMTHWGAEGNHVGYNILSAVINKCGNQYVGLRGISMVASVVNLVLIYRLARRFFTDWIPLATMITYVGFDLVNELCVQGRGYSISVTLFLMAAILLSRLTQTTQMTRSQCVILAFIIVIAMYILPWNIMWVLPMCLAVVFYLFLNGMRTREVSGQGRRNIYFSQLLNLLLSMLIAAIATILLYAITILESGAARLIERGGFASYSRYQLLLYDPLRAFAAGWNLMKDSFGAQEIRGGHYFMRWHSFVYGLSEAAAPHFGYILIVMGALGLVILISACILHFEESKTCMRLIMIFVQLWIPVLLIFVRRIPGNYAYMYMCVAMAFSISIVTNHVVTHVHSMNDKMGTAMFLLPMAMALTFFFMEVGSGRFYRAYDLRSDKIYEALIMVEPTHYTTPVVTDENQKFLMTFLYDEEPSINIDVADYLLIDRDMMQEVYYGTDASSWYFNYSSIPWDRVENMYRSYQNDSFILFTSR